MSSSESQADPVVALAAPLSGEVPPAHRLARLIAVATTSVIVILLVAWVRTDPRTNLETDWTSFDNAAERFFASEQVYQPWNGETEPLPYLYPPFVLWLALPLGFLGFFSSWAFSATLTVGTFIGGILLLARAVPGAADRTTGLVLATASGTVVAAALIGQYSGIYVLSLGLAAWLWVNDRQLLAGLALAILSMKPNLAIAVPVVLIWSRSWSALRGFTAGTVAALAASIPFGLDRWSGFASNVQQMAELQEQGQLFSDLMVTNVGAAQSALGLSSSSGVLFAIWLLSSAVLGVATLVAWTRPALAENPVRALSVLAGFMVVANPRMYFYDATLIVFAILGLWFTLDAAGGELSKRWLPRMAPVLWFFSWGGVFKSLNMFVGPLTGLVLVLVAVDIRSATATSSQELHAVDSDIADGPEALAA